MRRLREFSRSSWRIPSANL
ncbi:unnamed protein product [Linum tenue]|uniref:Uncharacterized protein n=1 Tax=Linum tenue TaxID=586396 RepID=A0AAV0QSX2_9ROSI|nr:unnamed protein product [Linum tenue]